MFRSLLLFTLLCTCGPAFSQVAKPVTDKVEIKHSSLQLSIDAGVGYALFNKRPDITVPTVDIPNSVDVTGERLRAVAGEAVGLTAAYQPLDKQYGVQLRLQYLSRGYQHVFVNDFDEGITFRDNYTAEVRFLDFMPGVSYFVGKNIQFSGGPYASVALSETENPFRAEPIHQRNDYGAHLGVRYGVGRLFASANFQRSFRDFSLVSFPDFNRGTPPPTSESPVSVIVVGLGYQLIR